MAATAFDTLKFARSLRERASLTPEQAEGFADAINEAFKDDVASRSDLRETELRLEAKLRETELRLEAKIEASKAEVIKWLFGVIGFQTLVILGAAIALARVV